MIKEKEIQTYFNDRHQELISRAMRSDAIGYNYQIKQRWFFERLRRVQGRMLDIGCNVGNLSFLLREYGIPSEQLQYNGIDIADKAIEVAKRRGIPGATFQTGNALALDFPDNHFDVVTLVEVIEHITDQLAAMREVTRVLKPGGLLLLSTPNAECKPWLFDECVRFTVWRMLGRKLVEKDDPLTLPELKRILCESGLTPLEGTCYYWYRPYHIFKGRLLWPPALAIKGLLGAMKHCKEIEETNRLTDEQKRIIAKASWRLLRSRQYEITKNREKKRHFN